MTGTIKLSPEERARLEKMVSELLDEEQEEKQGIMDHLAKDSSGKVKESIENCVTVLREDELMRGKIALNLFTERVDIVESPGWERTTPTLTDTDVRYIRLYMESRYGLTKERKIDDAIRIAANENRYHPICGWLAGLEWDGEPRIAKALHKFLGAAEDRYTAEALKLFMLGALNRVYEPGSKFEYMLCLVGKQGTGKSTFFRFLAGRDEWFSDDLRKLDDENIYRKLQGHWIMEMSEMLGVGGSRNIEEIKAFLSKQKDTYKIPYDVHPQDRLRQCVFGGTSNSMDMLPPDRTGNRRFLPVQTDPDNAETHILENENASREYFTQMWAEAMTIYRSNDYKLVFPSELSETLRKVQREFTPEDVRAGEIQAWLDETKHSAVCSRMLYSEALGHGTEEPRLCDLRAIKSIMDNSIEGWVSFSNPRTFPGYGRQRGWERVTEPYPFD